jgi:prevent-host-death family protein
MAITYTVTDARDHLGELVNKVRYGGEQVEITQHGTPAVAVVSIERLAYLQRLEDEHDIAEAEAALAADGPGRILTRDQLTAELVARGVPAHDL